MQYNDFMSQMRNFMPIGAEINSYMYAARSAWTIMERFRQHISQDEYIWYNEHQDKIILTYGKNPQDLKDIYLGEL